VECLSWRWSRVRPGPERPDLLPGGQGLGGGVPIGVIGMTHASVGGAIATA